MADRDGALEFLIEILRRVAAVTDRAILNQRFRMDDAVLEPHAIDEGLERRAGRADRLSDVDLAGAPLIEIANRRHACQNFAARDIDRHHPDRDIGTQRLAAVAHQLFKLALQGRIDREVMQLAVRRRRHGLIGRMRTQHRHREPARRHRFAPRLRDLDIGREARRADAIEHAVARAPRRVDRAVRPAQFGRLRQGDEKRDLAEGQTTRLMTEVGERSRADAFDVAAIGRKLEVKRQNLLLGELQFDLDRTHDLAEFYRKAAPMTRLYEPGHLHRERRAAGDDMAAVHEFSRGPHQRQRIDAVVLLEALVLVRKQRRHIALVDALDACRQAPAAVGRRIGAQQPPVAIDDLHRNVEVLAERRRPQRDDPADRCRNEQRCCGRGNAKASPPPRRPSCLPPPLWGRVGVGGREVLARMCHIARPPPPTPPRKGEGSRKRGIGISRSSKGRSVVQRTARRIAHRAA